jgi:hypothetical protein
MRKLRDGTILNSNTRLNKAPDNQSKYNNFSIHKAMITKSISKDDDKNQDKKGVGYEAVICGGEREGEVIRKLRPLCSFGGNENYNEVVYKPKEQVLSGKDKGEKTPPEHTDGSYVIVGFLNGHYNHPIILGGWAQPNNSEYGAKVKRKISRTSVEH